MPLLVCVQAVLMTAVRSHDYTNVGEGTSVLIDDVSLEPPETRLRRGGGCRAWGR